MPRMQFGLSATERARGDLPELPVVNMFAEEAPTEQTGVTLQSRPGLSDRGADMGAGPVEALFKRDGVLSAALFGLSAGSLYEGAVNRGPVPGSGVGSIAGNEAGVVATMGAVARFWNGTVIADIAFPDTADVIKVFTGGARFWMIRKDTGKLYFTPALATTVDALDFVTAETLPDRLLDGLWIDDIAILFGAESVEFWPNTGDSETPIEPLEGRVFEKGIKATGCASPFGASFAWVTNDNQVCISDPENIVSNEGLEARIATSVATRLFRFFIEGTEFLALRLDTQTYVYSNRSRLWSEFVSGGQTNWVPQCYAGGVFGSAFDGKTMEWGGAHLDLSGVLERRFRAGFALNSGGFPLNSVTLRTNVGQTPYLTGDYLDPVVEMRISRDAGQTWGAWRSVSLGAQGNYRQRVQWRACGLASQPGSLHEFRVTAPVPLRVSDVLVNEPVGGR